MKQAEMNRSFELRTQSYNICKSFWGLMATCKDHDKFSDARSAYRKMLKYGTAMDNLKVKMAKGKEVQAKYAKQIASGELDMVKMIEVQGKFLDKEVAYKKQIKKFREYNAEYKKAKRVFDAINRKEDMTVYVENYFYSEKGLKAIHKELGYNAYTLNNFRDKKPMQATARQQEVFDSKQS